MRLFLLLLLPALCQAGIGEDLQQGPSRADDITYQWLTDAAVPSHDTAHVALFGQIFKQTKVKTLLEFGLGYSTKFFLENCNKVISVDIITHGYGPEVMKKFLGLYSDYSNWIPIALFSGYLGCDYGWAPYKHLGSESLYKATSYRHAHHKSYAPIDGFYLVELNAFVTNLLKYNKATAAFVGHAIFLRGDVVQILFGKVPVIVAHNTNNRRYGVMDDVHGLVQVVTPEDYEEIFFPLQGGTTAWVQKKKEWSGLIEGLKKYAQGI